MNPASNPKLRGSANFIRATLAASPTIIADTLNLVFLGRGSSGKTCLTHALAGQTFNPQSRETQGLDTSILNGSACNLPGVKLNIQDFAGQEITHGLHSLFIKQGSIFIIVASGHYADRDVGHWLRVIDSNSDRMAIKQVIIAHNKADCPSEPQNPIQRFSFSRDFPNFKIDIVRTDCKTGKGIDEFKSLIKAVAAETIAAPGTCADFEAVKELVTLNLKKWMKNADFIRILEEQRVVQEEDKRLCLKHLIDTDVIVPVTFEQLASPQSVDILNPGWFSQGVYGLLRFAESKGGRINQDESLQHLNSLSEVDCQILAEKLKRH